MSEPVVVKSSYGHSTVYESLVFPDWTSSYLWRWGIWQVEAFFARVGYRVMLVDGGAGL